MTIDFDNELASSRHDPISSDDALADLDRALDAARLKHAWMTAAIAEANAEAARMAAEIAALEAKKATLIVTMLAMAQGHRITAH